MFEDEEMADYMSKYDIQGGKVSIQRDLFQV